MISCQAISSRRPVLIGFANSSTANPTIPAHQTNDLLVAAGFASSNTLATLPSGWTDWPPDAGAQTGNSVSLRLVYQVASAPGTTITWTDAGSARPVWVFRNATRSVNRFVNASAGTTCAWPTLTLTGPSLICTLAYKASAQTAIDVVTPPELVWTPRVTKNTSVAALVLDSVDWQATFAPASRTFDTSSGASELLAFAIRTS